LRRLSNLRRFMLGSSFSSRYYRLRENQTTQLITRTSLMRRW
jgi:hypothetical protein